MVLKVTLAAEKANFGDILFSVPTADAMADAVETVSALCRSKAGESYGSMNSPYFLRLETELAAMRKTDTAYHFLVLKEIVELSQAEGYPVMFEGTMAGSLIAFLLGITAINPMSPYDPCSAKGVTDDQDGGESLPVELVFGTFHAPKTPDFSFEVAAAVRPLIQHRLDAAFGMVKSDDDLYRQITWVDSTKCAILGDLAKNVGAPTDNQVHQPEVYLQVLKDIALSRDVWTKRELHKFTSCDFSTLVKLYGYLQGTFRSPHTLQKIYDPHFFTTRDDLFHALRSCGMSAEDALDTAKYGVWSHGECREKYRLLLEEYHAPLWLYEYFEQVSNLWPATAFISRLHISCIAAWYQLHYPGEFDSCLKKHRRRKTTKFKKT